MEPVKLLELMSNHRRNVRFPRCGEIVPRSEKPETLRAVTLGRWMLQEMPVQEQTVLFVDQFVVRTPSGSEVMPFLKASSASRSVVRSESVAGDTSVMMFKITRRRA